MTEGEWQANWQTTKSTKCVHLLRRLLEVSKSGQCHWAGPQLGGWTGWAGGEGELGLTA